MFRKNVGIPNIFMKMVYKIFKFQKHFRKKSRIFVIYTFSKHCHVLALRSRLPIGRLFQFDLSLLSCPNVPVPDFLSKTSCPDLSVLSRLSCPL
jgi:hypothetical protein